MQLTRLSSILNYIVKKYRAYSKLKKALAAKASQEQNKATTSMEAKESATMSNRYENSNKAFEDIRRAGLEDSVQKAQPHSRVCVAQEHCRIHVPWTRKQAQRGSIPVRLRIHLYHTKIPTDQKHFVFSFTELEAPIAC
jgi:hypothetical protein